VERHPFVRVIEELTVIGAEILGHHARGERFVFFGQRRAFDVGSQEAPHGVFIGFEVFSRRDDTVLMDGGFQFGHIQEFPHIGLLRA